MVKYVPILKWKAGEKESIKHLEKNQIEQICPLIELVDSISEDQLISEICETGLKCAFVDNIYLEETDLKFYENLVDNVETDKLNLIPVFYIDDLYTDVSSVNNYDEISIRLQIPEPINSIHYMNFFRKIFKESNVKVDLILDLTVVGDLETATLKYIGLEKTLIQLKDYYGKINKLIISSTSFPNSLNDLEAGEDKKFTRYELSILNKISEIPFYKDFMDKLVYSDYGVNKFTDTEMDFSKLQYGVLPKIKYTTDKFYYVQKGKKNRIKNVYTISVFDMCNKIIKSSFFYGKEFSYGDGEIYNKATEKKGPGGNKDWVTISTVHHIAAILKQLSN